MTEAITLFVLLMTPRPACVEAAVKKNLTNCHEVSRETGIVYATYPLQYEAKPETVCDKVPEKDRVPVPKQEYKISLGYPDMSDDGCNDKALGTIEAKPYERFITMSSVTLSGTIFSMDASSFTIIPPARPSKRRKK